MRIEDVTSAQRQNRAVEQQRSTEQRRPMRADALSTEASEDLLKPTTTEAPKAPEPKPNMEQVEKRQVPAAAEAVSQEHLGEIAKMLSKELPQISSTAIGFEVEAGDPPVLVMRDSETGEEIRRIPSDEIQKLSEALEDLKGVIVDAYAGGDDSGRTGKS